MLTKYLNFKLKPRIEKLNFNLKHQLYYKWKRHSVFYYVRKKQSIMNKQSITPTVL